MLLYGEAEADKIKDKHQIDRETLIKALEQSWMG